MCRACSRVRKRHVMGKRHVMAAWTAVAQRCILDGERGVFRGEGDERVSRGKQRGGGRWPAAPPEALHCREAADRGANSGGGCVGLSRGAGAEAARSSTSAHRFRSPSRSAGPEKSVPYRPGRASYGQATLHPLPGTRPTCDTMPQTRVRATQFTRLCNA